MASPMQFVPRLLTPAQEHDPQRRRALLGTEQVRHSRLAQDTRRSAHRPGHRFCQPCREDRIYEATDAPSVCVGSDIAFKIVQAYQIVDAIHVQGVSASGRIWARVDTASPQFISNNRSTSNLSLSVAPSDNLFHHRSALSVVQPMAASSGNDALCRSVHRTSRPPGDVGLATKATLSVCEKPQER